MVLHIAAPPAYLCIGWIQLLAEQIGVRVTDIPDAEEAMQATGKAHRHLKVCDLLHTAQHQHTLLHILENEKKIIIKKHDQYHVRRCAEYSSDSWECYGENNNIKKIY